MSPLSTKNSLEFQEEFDPRLISSLYRNFKDPIQAILEIIDNAVDDLIEGSPMLISFLIQKDSLRIINKGGVGMGKKELKAFFIWGLSSKRGKLGRYGQGGKAAMGYLGKSWTISTTKIHEDQEYVVSERDWDNRETGLKKYISEIIKTTNVNEGIVKIEISNLKRKVSKSELERALGKTYRPLIKSNKIEIYSSLNEKVVPEDYILEIPEDWFKIELKNGKKITGWLGILGAGSKIRGGVRVYSFGRLILDKEWFGQREPSFKQSIDRLIGEIYLDLDEVELTMNKSDIDRGSPLYIEIKGEMYKLMDPYVKLLLEEKEKDLPTEKEQKTAKYSGQVWAEFLKYLQQEQKGGTMPGLPIDYGQKPPEFNLDKRMKTVGSIQGNTDNIRQNSPATPPPIIRIGKRKRTGGFPEPILQPLSESVRYEVLEDKGRKMIKINTSFSIYKLRKNQLPLYIWETLAIEYSKAEDSETQSVQEYIEELNEILRELGAFIKTGSININNPNFEITKN